MGYTHYWSNMAPKNGKISPSTVDAARKIVSKAEEEESIKILDSFGEGEPVISEELIALNGDAKEGLDHESFVISTNSRELGFNFCKTAQKPYDLVVTAILIIAEYNGDIENSRSDGNVEDWESGLELAQAVMPEALLSIPAGISR